MVTGPYLYTHAPEVWAYLPNEMDVYYRVVRPYGYEPVCMLLNKLAPP